MGAKRTEAVGVTLLLAVSGVCVSLLGVTRLVIGLLALILVLLFTMSRTRRSRDAAHEDDATLLWDVFLLPIVIGIAPVSTSASLVAAVALVCIGVHRLTSRTWNLQLPLPLVFLLIASLPVLVRSTPALTMLGAAVLLVGVLVAIAEHISTRRVVTSLVDGLGIYLILNVAGYVVGVTSSIAALRSVSTSVSGGPFGLRVLFPFASNAEAPAIAAALFVVGVLGFRGAHSPRRVLRAAGLFAACFVALGANYRAPMVAGAIVLLTIWLSPRALIRTASVVAIIALTLPLTYAHVRHLTDPAIDRVVNVVPYLERVEERGNTGSLTGRDRVWMLAVRYWNETPWLERAIGWGNNGQVKSGASSSYAPLLRGAVRDPTHATVHNTGLQQLFDAGVLGLMALIAAIVVAVTRWRSAGDAGVVAIALVITASLVAATDVGMTPGRVDLSFIVLVLSVAAIRKTPQSLLIEKASVGDTTDSGEVARDGRLIKVVGGD